MTMIYPDDRVLVAVVPTVADWERVQDAGWYRIPAKRAPTEVPHVDWLAFYFTAKFGVDRWAIHYYARVTGHELVSRAALIPTQPNHPRAGQWYYKVMLGPIRHKLPPITSPTWRRISFIFTTGDRFEQAHTTNDLLSDTAPDGRRYVVLRETGDEDW